MMLKRILIIFTILLSIICLLFIANHLILYGTPWQNSEAKQEISSYLTAKFQGQATIEKVFFDFERGGFSAKAKTLNSPSVEFDIYHIGTDLANNYYLRKWGNDINAIVQNELPDNTFQVGLVLNDTVALNNEYGSGAINEITDYSSVNEKISDDSGFVIDVPYNHSELSQDDGQKIYQIVKTLKDNFKFRYICVNLQDECLPNIPYASLQEFNLENFENGYLGIKA